MRQIKPQNSLVWLYEPLEDDTGFTRRKLFSFEAAYLDGKLYLAVGEKEEPWNGMMVCTFKEHHISLQHEFPELIQHELLGKWLYISQDHPDFETVAVDMVELAKRRDRRLGVLSRHRPKTRRKKQRV